MQLNRSRNSFSDAVEASVAALPIASGGSAGAKVAKRVVVTGCSGSIGRPVCAWLARSGHTVIGFDAVSSDALTGVCSEVVTGDICDAEAVAAVLTGADVLIHLAAFPDIKDADGNIAGFVDKLLMPNVQGLYVSGNMLTQGGPWPLDCIGFPPTPF
jgi:putative NADH-flavin reductase